MPAMPLILAGHEAVRFPPRQRPKLSASHRRWTSLASACINAETGVPAKFPRDRAALPTDAADTHSQPETRNKGEAHCGKQRAEKQRVAHRHALWHTCTRAAAGRAVRQCNVRGQSPLNAAEQIPKCRTG